jgi:hypothetical protein
MRSPTSICIDKLLRLSGRPDAPDLIDVRHDDGLVPSDRRRPIGTADCRDRPAVSTREAHTWAAARPVRVSA